MRIARPAASDPLGSAGGTPALPGIGPCRCYTHATVGKTLARHALQRASKIPQAGIGEDIGGFRVSHGNWAGSSCRPDGRFRVLVNGAALEISINSIGALAKGQLHRAPGYAAAVGLLRRARTRKASARYCYSVWLRHLLALHQNGLAPKLEVVAEVGPGDSIGTGLAALLSGAEFYVAVDFVRYANVSENLDVFEELLDLFERRAPLPDDEEFPDIYPKLRSCRFPDWLPAGAWRRQSPKNKARAGVFRLERVVHPLLRPLRPRRCGRAWRRRLAHLAGRHGTC